MAWFFRNVLLASRQSKNTAETSINCPNFGNIVTNCGVIRRKVVPLDANPLIQAARTRIQRCRSRNSKPATLTKNMAIDSIR
jgi:hypothetical protein